MRIEGCFVAITSPFTDGELDRDTLAAHASWMVDNGVSGIVVCGTTGESATLTDDEKIVAMNVVMDAVGDRATVIGGAGNNCTAESLEFVDRVNEEARVHAIMSVTPYYVKPPQRGIIGHFEAIADRSRYPVMIYNVPGRTVTSMTVDTMAHLARHENVFAVKEASANLFEDTFLIEQSAGHASLLSGDDATAMPFIVLGGHGVVSVVGNIAPKLMSDMCSAAQNGDLAAARDAHQRICHLHRLCFSDSNPIVPKAILERLGFGSRSVRLPLADASAAQTEEAWQMAVELGVAR